MKTLLACLFAAVSATTAFGAEPNAYLASLNGTSLSILNPAGIETGFVPIVNTTYDWSFTPDGKTAFVTTLDRKRVPPTPIGASIYQVNVATRQVVNSLPQNGAALLKVSPDGTTLFAVNYDESIWVYNISTGTVVAMVPSGNPIAGLTPASAHISPDGNTLWYVSYPCLLCAGGTLTGVDVHTFAVPHLYQINTFAPRSFALLNDTTAYISAATSSTSSEIVKYNLTTGAAEGTIPFSASSVGIVGSTLLATSGAEIAAISTSTGAVLDEVTVPFEAGGFGISPDSKTMYVYGAPAGSAGQTSVQLVTLKDFRLGASFPLPYLSTGVRVNPVDGSLWSASSLPNLVESFNVGFSGQPLPPVYGEAVASLNTAIPLPDGSKVYAVSSNGASIDVLNGESLELLSAIPITTPASQVYFGGAASPDGTRVYLLDNGLQVVDTITDRLIGTIPAQTNREETAVTVSPDSSTVFIASFIQGYTRLSAYDTSTFVRVAVSKLLSGDGLTASVSPDGTHLFLMGQTSTTVLDAHTLVQENIIGASGVLSPDDSTIYTVVTSGGPPPTSLRIAALDVATLQVKKLYPVPLPPNSDIYGAYLALSPDGSMLALSVNTPLVFTPLTVIDVSSGLLTSLNSYLVGPMWFAN